MLGVLIWSFRDKSLECLGLRVEGLKACWFTASWLEDLRLQGFLQLFGRHSAEGFGFRALLV